MKIVEEQNQNIDLQDQVEDCMDLVEQKEAEVHTEENLVEENLEVQNLEEKDIEEQTAEGQNSGEEDSPENLERESEIQIPFFNIT